MSVHWDGRHFWWLCIWGCSEFDFLNAPAAQESFETHHCRMDS